MVYDLFPPYREVVFHFLTTLDGRTYHTHTLTRTLVGSVFVSVVCLFTVSELSLAYAEYLERMFDNSDDLVVVDLFTVPHDVDLNNPVLIEWTDVD